MEKSRRKSQRKYKGAKFTQAEPALIEGTKLPTKMKESFLKIIALLIIVGLNWTGLSAVIKTVAYFNDTENSSANLMQAGTLDFSLDTPQNNFGPRQEVALNMMPGDLVTREIKIKNDGTLPFQYNVQTEKISGDDDFCAGLQLIAKLNGEIKYDDSLMDFELLEPIEISDLEDNWFFIAYLPYESNFQNKICQFKFVFDGWQDNIENYGDAGFNDSEEVSNHLASWGLRINEVYYDVAPGKGSEDDDEWIELYNPTNQDINVKDWTITDNYAPSIIHAHKIIPAGGFAVVSKNASTWAPGTGYWILPPGTTKIILGQKIGNDLANTVDMLILKDNYGNIIDQMNWGVPDLTWPNYNANLWVPGLTVAEGHSLARRIAGHDTNQAPDWEDLTNPNPGTNPHLVDDEELIIEESGEEPAAEEPVSETMEFPELEFSEDGFFQTEPPQIELPEFDAVGATSPSTGGVVAPAETEETEEIEEIEEIEEQEVGGEEELESQDENYESGVVNQEFDETPAEEPAEEEEMEEDSPMSIKEEGIVEEEVVEEIVEEQLVDEEEPDEEEGEPDSDVDTELTQEQPADEEEPVDEPEVVEVDDGGDDEGDEEGDGGSGGENAGGDGSEDESGGESAAEGGVEE